MNPELRKQLFFRKHLIGIFAILALTLMLPLTLLFSQSNQQTKQFAAQPSQPLPTLTPPPGFALPTSIQSVPVQTTSSVAGNTKSTKISLNLCLHGIGNCGDNVASQSAGNANPVHMSRQLTLSIYDKDFKLIKELTGEINYSPAITKFTGLIDAENLPSGIYNIKISTPGYLPSFIPAAQNIKTAQSNTLPDLSLVSGDVDRNNILNLQDYTLLMKCFDKPGEKNPCTAEQQQASDLNDDGTVNGVDYNLLMRETTNQKTLK